jgi:zinc transport system substrate-binding protein
VLQERVKEEEHVEGMQEEAEEEEGEADEHVWLSLKNAEILTGAVTDALCACDEANAQTYRQNLEAYQKKLEELDEAYAAVTKASSRNTVVFADRFPFRYLLDDYGIQYYAAFAGCSAETEASFDTVAFLAQQVNTLDLDVILQIERSAGKIADTVLHTAGKADVKVLTMDSMQAVTAKEVEEGSTYLSIMEKNLEVLREALQ